MSFKNEDLHSLYRYAYSLTHKDEWAWDLTSYAVEKLLNRVFVLNKMAYAKKVIRNRFIDESKLAFNSHRSLSESEEPVSIGDFEQMMLDQDEIKYLLSKIEPLERELLYLWAVEDYTLSEIAKLTNTPKGTLTSRLHRLKHKLKKIKEDHHE